MTNKTSHICPYCLNSFVNLKGHQTNSTAGNCKKMAGIAARIGFVKQYGEEAAAKFGKTYTAREYLDYMNATKAYRALNK